LKTKPGRLDRESPRFFYAPMVLSNIDVPREVMPAESNDQPTDTVGLCVSQPAAVGKGKLTPAG
jgi:hypothetical protein